MGCQGAAVRSAWSGERKDGFGGEMSLADLDNIGE